MENKVVKIGDKDIHVFYTKSYVTAVSSDLNRMIFKSEDEYLLVERKDEETFLENGFLQV